jgi:hypothetical protein
VVATRESANADGARTWFGNASYDFVGPDGKTCVSFPYAAEPPHGDSLHRVVFSKAELPGFAWGSGIAWSPCGRYLLFDYSRDRRRLSRDVVVLDLHLARLHVLPEYVRATRFNYPIVFTKAETDEVVAYKFSGGESWQSAA